MVEQPVVGEFIRVSKQIHGGLANVTNGCMQLLDLGGAECVAVLLGVEFGMI